MDERMVVAQSDVTGVLVRMEGVNEIALLVAPDEFGFGVAAGLEPVIDRVSLVDILKRAAGERRHAGLTGVRTALASLRTPGAGRKQVLGCLCGVDSCSGVTVRITVDGQSVTWSDLQHTTRPGATCYEHVGPFVFGLRQYLRALAHPVREAAPIRAD
jgi:hypothetical protein